MPSHLHLPPLTTEAHTPTSNCCVFYFAGFGILLYLLVRARARVYMCMCMCVLLPSINITRPAWWFCSIYDTELRPELI